MIYVLIFLLIVFAVTSAAYVYREEILCHKYKFRHFDAVEIPYVTMDIQGNTMNMIVDTGCAVSLLNIPSLKHCELLYKKVDKEVTLAAITEEKTRAKAISVDFNIGKKKVTEEFFLQNVDDFGNFEKMHNVTIHGLLGSSFFEANKCKIDFKTHSLIVP